MSPGKKIDLKDKIEDGEIDLSMLGLEDVPVKDIASVKKIYSLDLSNNHLVYLPSNFSTLTNLTKIDLSKNKLKELPENFGNLEKLVHLDLYKNELQHLPLSFHKLRNLKWLDLKDNPLVPAIAKIAGPCLDNKQCQSCARDIVQCYIQMNERIKLEREAREAQRQRDLAQKAKPEKKKKDKKEKNKQKDKNGNITKKNIVFESSGGEKTKYSDSKENLNIKQKKSLTMVVWSIFIFSFFSFIILFLATSAKIKCLQSLEEYIVDVWLKVREKLPATAEEYVIKFEDAFKTFHSFVGDKMVKLSDSLLRFSSHPQIKIVQDYVLSICNALNQKVTETINRYL